MDEQTPKKRRGFASMPIEKVRAIAAAGGRAVAPANRSFSRSRDLARVAGAKGGKAQRAETRMFSRDKELAREAGRKGGSRRREIVEVQA